MGSFRVSKFLRFWFPAIVYSGIIFYVSSVPNIDTNLSIPNFDKLIHILEYSILGFLLTRLFVGLEINGGKLVLLLIFFAVLLHGSLDEYLQSFVAGRSSSIADIIADIIGGLLGYFLYPFIIKTFKKG